MEQFSTSIAANGFSPNCAISFKIAMCACTACMNDTLRNTLAVKVRQLLHKMVILKSCRSTVSHCAHILIITNRMSLTRCQDWLFVRFIFAHKFPFRISINLDEYIWLQCRENRYLLTFA